jgi:predicted ATPase
MDSFYQFIREIELKKDDIDSFNIYPYNLKAVKSFNNIKLHPKITFIIGENGSGKSTLLEAIAIAFGFNPEGGTKNFNFSTESTHSELYKQLRIVKGVIKPKDGFFLRAESFYNVSSNIDELDTGSGGSRIIDSYGGISLHKQSHGESFMALMMNKFRSNGLYILDEPEAALSPKRQMAMISRLHDLTGMGAQFIISTHSPIIMAYPDSVIYSVDHDFEVLKYEDTDHYQITKRFLNDTEGMLKILMDK